MFNTLFSYKTNLSNDNITFDKKKIKIKTYKNEINLLLNNEDDIHEIQNLKNKINDISEKKWKIYRKYIDNYEFINIVDNNRAYYKFWEILYTYKDILFKKKSLYSLQLCEAPGGFILSLLDFINSLNINTTIKIYTMSLNDKNTPSYNIPLLSQHRNIDILPGINSKGDINNMYNISYIKQHCVNFDFISCDGGFDEGDKYNIKEQLHYKLILNEIIYNIELQANKGCFILKIFDIFTNTTVNIIYLLTLCYKSVYVYKPYTSRPTNSEKYLICNNFILNGDDKIFLLNNLKKLSSSLISKDILFFSLFDNINIHFLAKLNIINRNHIQVQKKYLNDAIKLHNSNLYYTKYKYNHNPYLNFDTWCKKFNYKYF